jgi:hypothetical protein
MQIKVSSKLGALNRISTALALAVLSVALSLIALNTNTGMTSSYFTESFNTTFTPTQSVYLPFVSFESSCTNPPSGTAIIAGQATVHGQPAQAGVPFSLWFQVFDSMPGIVETTTTRSDGSFCFRPVGLACRGIWYLVGFRYISGTMPADDYTDSWSSMVHTCESGKVYTATAEIGKYRP